MRLVEHADVIQREIVVFLCSAHEMQMIINVRNRKFSSFHPAGYTPAEACQRNLRVALLSFLGEPPLIAPLPADINGRVRVRTLGPPGRLAVAS